MGPGPGPCVVNDTVNYVFPGRSVLSWVDGGQGSAHVGGVEVNLLVGVVHPSGPQRGQARCDRDTVSCHPPVTGPLPTTLTPSP